MGREIYADKVVIYYLKHDYWLFSYSTLVHYNSLNIHSRNNLKKSFKSPDFADNDGHYPGNIALTVREIYNGKVDNKSEL